MAINQDALLGIGAFAKLTGVSVPSLRYYEQIGALVPEYVNPSTGYRYYNISQISNLRLVRLSIESGMSPRELKHYLYSQDEFQMQDLLEVFMEYAETNYRNAYIEKERMRELMMEYKRQIAVKNARFRWIRSEHMVLLQLYFSDTLDNLDYKEYVSRLAECTKIAQELDIVTLSQQGIELGADGCWYVYISILDEPGNESKIAGRDDMRIVRHIKEPFLTAAVHGANFESCFRNVFKTVDPSEILFLTELWAVPLLTGFAAVEITYKFNPHREEVRRAQTQMLGIPGWGKLVNGTAKVMAIEKTEGETEDESADAD